MKLDPRCALVLLLAYLIALSTISPGHNLLLLILCSLPMVGLLLAPVRKTELLAQAAYVLPFSFAIAAVALLRGHTAQAIFFLLRSYISILSVLIVTHLLSTLELLRAMEALGAPRFLIVVTEFLIRYLEVMRREADLMRLAALCRGAARSRLIASASLAMLFVRSLERSTAIHNAMLARGFNGRLPRIQPMLWQSRDTVALLLGLVLISGLRWSL
ncbi:energy-coupling factor transporter transmembrane component T [Bryobacter aggregatus]|uniref:energy-coupling factor transporter transmembrane component T n=1 Tax=Bryobacter aggregatus TaxID=360054 RepID=UPI0004E0CEC7|nr:energy-coupling factor transporter transmembrane component T [Bryobacter aggregatus]